MPVYEYVCPQHGPMREMRSISGRESPAQCTACGGVAERVISAPNLQLMSAGNRAAWSRNERSIHEPRQVRRRACGHTHADGASCRSHPTPATSTSLQQGSHGARPWMLGH